MCNWICADPNMESGTNEASHLTRIRSGTATDTATCVELKCFNHTKLDIYPGSRYLHRLVRSGKLIFAEVKVDDRSLSGLRTELANVV